MTEPAEDAQEPKEAPSTLMGAILAVQEALPAIAPTGENEGFKRRGEPSKYITLAQITETVFPLLRANGLVWITEPARDDDRELVLRYRLVHAESLAQMEEPGEWCEIRGTMALLAAKDNPQGQGAAITYARRQALCAVLGIVADEDDDGQRASQAQEASQQRQADLRNALRPMTDEEQANMREAVKSAGGDIDALLTEAGVGEGETPTIGQARRVKQLLAEAS